MNRYRNALPQLGGDLFLTDGGIETTLIYHDGLELPDFAAFDLLARPAGVAALRKYFQAYADIARQHRSGLILESATWRASPDWGARLGYDRAALAAANRRAIELLEPLRDALGAESIPAVISGCVGPRGDGYVAGQAMSLEQAESYHDEQVATFATTSADMVTAITMTSVPEAVGVARAARRFGMPVVISFTVETDGRLPAGDTLEGAIAAVDRATADYPAYYMINCAHPTHFQAELRAGASWLERIRGLRANASRRSHAELNEATELDAGDPHALAQEYAALKQLLPKLNVLGGCCGTDHRHITAMAVACVPFFRAAA